MALLSGRAVTAERPLISPGGLCRSVLMVFRALRILGERPHHDQPLAPYVLEPVWAM